MQTGKRMLFYCATVFQLFNILNMESSGEIPFDAADLVLDNASPLEKYLPALEKTGVFRRILQHDSQTATSQYKAMRMKERKAVSKEPSQLIRIGWVDPDYTDLYLGNSWALHKLVYYALVEQDVCPEIHLYEDGTATYAANPLAAYDTEGIDHAFYKERNSSSMWRSCCCISRGSLRGACPAT